MPSGMSTSPELLANDVTATVLQLLKLFKEDTLKVDVMDNVAASMELKRTEIQPANALL